MATLRFVVLGGSFGGLISAYELRKVLPRAHEVLLISNARTFVYRPALPFVALGTRDPGAITAELEPSLKKRGIGFLQATVTRIDPVTRRVFTSMGHVDYDYVVVALGAHLEREAVAGLDAYTECILWLDDALRVREKLRGFSGGHIAVLEVQETPLRCPAYEIAFGLDAYLRRRALREKSCIHFITYAESPFDVGGPKASKIVAQEFERRGIDVHTGAAVSRIADGIVYTRDGEAFEANLILAFPPYRGTDAVLRSKGVGDSRGFIPVHTTMESQRFPRLYAVGDAVAFPGPKSGRMAEVQAKVAAHNIACQVAARGKYKNYRSHVVCAMDMGDGKGMFAYRKEAPGQGPLRFSFAMPGRWPAIAKSALERYFMTAHF